MVMISIAEYERLKQNGGVESTWQEKVASARALITAELGDRELSSAVEVIRQMREERNELPWVRVWRE